VPSLSPGLRSLLLRLPLLIVVALAAWFFLGDRPRHVDLVYDLDDDARPSHVEVRITDLAGKTEAELAWGDAAAARDPMPHQPLLAPGEHHLHARLRYPDGRVADIERDLLVGGDTGTVIVHLP
jgi:hypothetical protein